MSKLIDADDFGNRMYHESFEKDTDMQRWDSGCWIRYKLFENVLGEQPAVQPDLSEYSDKLWKSAYERGKAEAEKPQWIPCSERLPEEETDVIVTRTFLGCKDGSHGWNNHIPPTTYVEVARYFDGEWTALSDEYKAVRSRHTDPIAWMPLPEPYREECEG